MDQIKTPFMDFGEKLTRERERERAALSGKSQTDGSAASFFDGLTWMAAWLVDHCEGEIVEEMLVLKWADDALKEHTKRQNDPGQPRRKQT